MEDNLQLGFIGLGAMGALIVPRLIEAGHTVTAWNRSRDKAEAILHSGMACADTPRAVAEQSEIVFSIVTDGAAVHAVALGDDGVLSGLKEGGIYIDMSTIPTANDCRSACCALASSSRASEQTGHTGGNHARQEIRCAP